MPENKSVSHSSTDRHRTGSNSQSKAKRSEAAKKGWETRRRNAVKRG